MGTTAEKPIHNFKAVLTALPTPLVILSPQEPDFIVKEITNAFLNLCEINREDLIEKPFFSAFDNITEENYKSSLDKISSTLKKVVSSKEPIESDIFEFDIKVDNSSEKKHLYLQFKYSPVLNQDGSVDSVILVADDVTNLVKLKEINSSPGSREELHNLNEHLATQAAENKAQYESASQELDDFVYSVSHDLRAPLRRIDGFSQELLNEYVDKLDETGIHYLSRIRQGAQDMGQLIDDLLKLSRISRKSIDREEINLGAVAKSAFDELVDMEPERNVSFKVDGDLVVNADKGLLKSMLGNLISNALKFTSKEKVAEIQIGSRIIDGEKVFYISDNGVGFDPAYIHKLFKAFSRLHSHTEFGGTGIGLATVKRILTLHGGNIWAESSKGSGANFYFKF